MRYNIKVYNEKGEEKETLRNLKYSQKEAIISVLKRHGIRFSVFEIEE